MVCAKPHRWLVDISVEAAQARAEQARVWSRFVMDDCIIWRARMLEHT